jgi:hypothetical protein
MSIAGAGPSGICSHAGLGISLVRTNEAARTGLRERANGGMDAIKITIETGPASAGENHPMMPVSMIRAIVREAAAGSPNDS